MKVIIASVLALASVGYVLAEPPVYLPPQQSSNNGYNQQYQQQGNGYQQPSQQYGAPSGPGGYPGAGSGYPGAQSGSGGYDEGQYEPANYQFEYHVEDAPSGNNFGHEEQRQGDVAMGRYFVLLPDGRTQIVEYVADKDGYRPKIRYEGTANNGGQGGQGGYEGGYSRGGPSGSGAGGYNY